MSDNSLFLGIDTSNYTTSVALVDYKGEVILNLKKLLDVKEGERGLRQSDALFAHTKNLPEIMKRLNDFLNSHHPNRDICAVGVSSTPRDAEGSYMPCFLSGVSAANTAAAVCGCPIYEFSHQNGHIMAALYSADKMSLAEKADSFAAFHISGGTTELLLVRPNEMGFSAELAGGTLDMNAGQAIDRTGVAMGLKFPCGKEMERLCSERGDIPHLKTKISVKDLECNISGLENLAAKVYRESGDRALTSAYCFDFIADTIEELSKNLRSKHPDIPIIFAGGVMSNRRIADRLRSLGNVYFSAPEFSSDNASGTALLCRRRYISESK